MGIKTRHPSITQKDVLNNTTQFPILEMRKDSPINLKANPETAFTFIENKPISLSFTNGAAF